MPIHRVPRASLHEDLQQIARVGERVVSITNDANDPDRYIVLTEYPDGVTELRGAAL